MYRSRALSLLITRGREHPCAVEMNGEQQLDADLGSGVEVEEFSWEDYLEETGATTAPYASFKHLWCFLPELSVLEGQSQLLSHQGNHMGGGYMFAKWVCPWDEAGGGSEEGP